MTTYWDKRAVTRRRLLRGSLAGISAAAAVSIFGCGGNDDDKEAPSDVNSILYQPVDTTSSAKRGGVFKGWSTGDPENWDYYNFGGRSQAFHNFTGIKLMRMKPGYMQDPALEYEMEAAESYEYSGDKLTLTVKLNPRAKFAPFSSSGFNNGVPASVANRQIDADDVVFSYERLRNTPSARNGGAQELFNEINPNGAILSVNKIDSRTIQYKLHHPSSALLVSLANASVSYPYILPKEGRDGGIDFFTTQVAGGPYYVEKFEPSVNVTLKRNPNYEALFPNQKVPFFDTVELPRVIDQAQQWAQFRAGNIYTGPIAGPVEDRLELKDDIPELQMWAAFEADRNNMWFGQNSQHAFIDVRLRQAMSLAWDRDTHINVVYSGDTLESRGIPADPKWAGAISCSTGGSGTGGTFRGYWLDPKSKEFGPNAKYFTLGKTRADDIAEAKALIRAATGKDEMEFEHIAIIQVAGGAPTYSVEVMNASIAEAGFRPNVKPMLYSDYVIYRATEIKGNWKGVVSLGRYAPADPATYYWTYFHKTGGLFNGYSADGRGADRNLDSSGNPMGDPTMNDFVEKMYAEFDEQKRQALSADLQRYHAKMNYLPHYPGGANTIYVGWPVVQNRQVWQSLAFDNPYRYEWLDETKAPLNKTS
jgi:ABC-type transport system substrate-binding protein